MKHEEKEADDNVSTVVQFVLLGFSEISNLQGFLPGVFSIIYMVILIGNSLIVIITRLDPALHKPMHFFPGTFFYIGNLLCFNHSPEDSGQPLDQG
ncbi:Hypothetical predicted protein [Marmota monax]|uniref:G-protein coupled receptors family 1 profile domain-containing protein n=1 Tax=Marmota monax TaxID=9995 RepID=A0A5E4CX54_MARMO|nr:Hypothetical predicted protein [Marmota monax]